MLEACRFEFVEQQHGVVARKVTSGQSAAEGESEEESEGVEEASFSTEEEVPKGKVANLLLRKRGILQGYWRCIASLCNYAQGYASVYKDKSIFRECSWRSSAPRRIEDNFMDTEEGPQA